MWSKCAVHTARSASCSGYAAYTAFRWVSHVFQNAQEPFSWLGDGFCDLIANVQSCSWDLGDCCESTCDDSLKDACNDAAGSGCFGANCDVWVAVGDTCGVLELQYGCDCSGCVCDENAKIPAYDCGTGGYACVDPDAAESPKFPEGCEPDDDVEVSWIGDGFCDAEELNTEVCVDRSFSKPSVGDPVPAVRVQHAPLVGC